MQSGRLFYKIMLWALGVAAAAGVLAMLMASYRILGRVSGTALVTGIASGMAWGLGEKLDPPRLRDSRRLGIAATVVAYLFALVGIWSEQFDEEAWGTAFVTGVAGPVASLCLGTRWLRGMRVAAWTGVVVAALGWLTAMCGIWGEAHESDWIATSLLIAGYGGLGTVCLVRVELHASHWWRWAGVAAAAAAGVLLVLDVWDVLQSRHSLEKTVIVLSSIGLVVAHANLCQLVPLHGGQQWVRRGTIAAAVVTAVCVDVMSVFEVMGDSMFARAAGAAAIAMGCGSLALPVLHRYNQTAARQLALSTATVADSITFFCPRCQMRQTTPFGRVECTSCGLVLRLEREPEPPLDSLSGPPLQPVGRPDDELPGC